jgi:hypothetical protein
MRLFGGNREAEQDSGGTQGAPGGAGAPAGERRRLRRGPVVTFRVRPEAMLDRPSRAEIDLAGSTIAARLRKEDGFELGDDGAFTVMLANTDPQAARVAAARLASEITHRSAAVNRRKWIAELVE